MTATVPWAALTVLTAAALLILFGNTLAARVRRRQWIRFARDRWPARPSIEQASHDRAEVAHDPREDQ